MQIHQVFEDPRLSYHFYQGHLVRIIANKDIQLLLESSKTHCVPNE